MPETSCGGRNHVSSSTSGNRGLHVAGLILARGGSQGIPLKNLAPLGSHPLLAWSLGAMAHFGGFDSLWVSTDHAAIASCATSLGKFFYITKDDLSASLL